MGCWCKESLSSPWSAQGYRRLRMRRMGTSGFEGWGLGRDKFGAGLGSGWSWPSKALGTQTVARPPGLDALALLCLSCLTYKMG